MDAKKIIDSLKKLKEANVEAFDEVKSFIDGKKDGEVSVEIKTDEIKPTDMVTCPECGCEFSPNKDEEDAKEGEDTDEEPDALESLMGK